MKVIINTKNLKTININNVLQTSITHTGTAEDDNDYNTLQIIYMVKKCKYIINYRLSKISTCIVLEEAIDE